MYWSAGGRPADDFYFGGVKMKKLGWGLGMSGWLISMFPILLTKCDESVMVTLSFCKSLSRLRRRKLSLFGY